MKRLIFIAIMMSFLCSCADRDICRKLEDVESYIMERPDSALKVLESIDRTELTTERSRAHHALLHAMALDKNGIDVTSDSLAMIAVEYYKDNEPQGNYARALYYLGKCYYYRGEYDKAILEYSKAEKVAAGADRLYLGMIKCGQADTYNRTYNSIEELNCIQQALDIFKEIGAEHYIRPVMLSLGRAYHNCDKYEEAVEIYNNIIESSHEVDYYTIEALTFSAHSMLESDNVDYSAVCNRFRQVKEVYGVDLQEKDYWAWAYSLCMIGHKDDANMILDSIKHSDSNISYLWKSRIASIYNDYESAFKYYKLTILEENNIVKNLLTESLATYQRNYFQSELENAEYRVKIRNMELKVVLCIVFLILLIVFVAIKVYVRKQKAEKTRLLEYAEEIKRQLNEAEKNDYSSLKRKYISLYKTRFETIGTLCDQYMQAEGRTDIESLMFKKVEALIREVNNDTENRVAFEAMLDGDLDMIMTHLRTEMPKFKEIDYSIFSYLVVGFDATTISRLLDIAVNNVYTRKRRIRIRIEEKNPEHASQFLEILN